MLLRQMTDVHLEELPHVAYALMQGHDPSGYFFWIADKVGACAVCVPVKLRTGHRRETTRLRNLGPSVKHVTGPQIFGGHSVLSNEAQVADRYLDVLGRYAGFFALFEDFHGYVDFFLLQDLVSADYEAVRFFMPFTDFSPPAIPRDLDTYLEFRRLSIKFTEARNRRIDQLALDVD